MESINTVESSVPIALVPISQNERLSEFNFETAGMMDSAKVSELSQ